MARVRIVLRGSADMLGGVGRPTAGEKAKGKSDGKRQTGDLRILTGFRPRDYATERTLASANCSVRHFQRESASVPALHSSQLVRPGNYAQGIVRPALRGARLHPSVACESAPSVSPRPARGPAKRDHPRTAEQRTGASPRDPRACESAPAEAASRQEHDGLQA